MGFFSGLKSSLQNLVFGKTVDDEYFDELEEQLIMADTGALTAEMLTKRLKERARKDHITDSAKLVPVISEIVAEMLTITPQTQPTDNPRVILVIGVNGVGKTTTIGKLAKMFSLQGKEVLLAAADTFRAAAIEQLCVWGERAGCRVISQAQGSDPAAVIHDALAAGTARGAEVIICDTAGRLHNKKNLMDELSKIRRVINKELPDCVPEVLLVLDATTGQNAVVQAKQFREVAGVDGVVLTKLDGTAKGGVVIAIANELGLPVKYVGMGEGIEDLAPFEPLEFARALFGSEEGAND